MKTCTGCQEERPLDEFWKHPLGRDGLRAQCKRCIRAKTGTPEAKRATKAYYRAWQLKRLYGITVEQFESRLAAQDHRCAICGTDDPGRRGWCVDHDHATGQVRGILCLKCNTGLGNFQDSPAALAKAIVYLGAQ